MTDSFSVIERPQSQLFWKFVKAFLCDRTRIQPPTQYDVQTSFIVLKLRQQLHALLGDLDRRELSKS